MGRLYDARGNHYVVASPELLVSRGLSISSEPSEAAKNAQKWAPMAVDVLCRATGPTVSVKPFISDGLLVGPFESEPPFNLIIVNTNGSLAERSGNGLTIFATHLKDEGLAPHGPFLLNVHYGFAEPQDVTAELRRHNDCDGVWLSFGQPSFGPKTVDIRPEAARPSVINGIELSHVPALATLNPDWAESQFVRIGNPHCVTILRDAGQLPSWEELHTDGLFQALMQIAYPSDAVLPGGLICSRGVNLQWAAKVGPNQIAARIFERGEGPTRSSGTSAVAIAAAALRMGLVSGPHVGIQMLGGEAPVFARLIGNKYEMSLFGVASAA